MCFTSHHLAALSRDVFKGEPYMFVGSIDQMLSDVKENLQILKSVFLLLQKGVRPSSPRISKLYTTSFTKQFQGIKDKDALIRAVKEELAKYVRAADNQLALVEAIGSCCGHKISLDKEFDELERMCKNAGKVLEMKIELEGTTLDGDDISGALWRAVAATKEDRQTALNKIDAVMEDLRYKNHTCPVCRYRPAIYYATPCMHPCFCYKCMTELANVDCVFSHCFICEARVSSVERLAYMNTGV